MASTGVPWFVIGVIHNMEGSLNFKTHLHNGDPLAARTVQVPKGRPMAGTPPFRWEDSAVDALQFDKMTSLKNWTLPTTLFKLEGFNGFGYRKGHPEVLTPYLWSFSNHYTKGKFVKDGVFDPNATSAQCGEAAILQVLVKDGTIVFSLGAALRQHRRNIALRYEPHRNSSHNFCGFNVHHGHKIRPRAGNI